MPGGNGAQTRQADALPPVEKHTQKENENGQENSGSRVDRSDYRVHGGGDFGNPVADPRGGNQPRGVAEGANLKRVNEAQTDKANAGEAVAGGSGNTGNRVGGRVERTDVAGAVEPDSLSATLAKLGRASNFDGRTFTESATLEPPVDVATTRGELSVSETKQTVATRGKSRPTVEAVKSSKGTWQFRLRWNSEPGRPVHYVLTVADSTYEIIRKGNYEGYKKALIADYEASAVSAD